ncbi:unnamed protein product [Hermetia illucens]|uniref:Uncharacterized protein n=1 Tax=Hermetia illucens TaxID=343691 RepID=A0A7R8UJ93_HERIL|nr:unnamed protein product [Hermetia illucens]
MGGNSDHRNVSTNVDETSSLSALAAEQNASLAGVEKDDACSPVGPVIQSSDPKDDQLDMVDSGTDFTSQRASEPLDVSALVMSEEENKVTYGNSNRNSGSCLSDFLNEARDNQSNMLDSGFRSTIQELDLDKFINEEKRGSTYEGSERNNDSVLSDTLNEAESNQFYKEPKTWHDETPEEEGSDLTFGKSEPDTGSSASGAFNVANQDLKTDFYESITSTMETDRSPVTFTSENIFDHNEQLDSESISLISGKADSQFTSYSTNVDYQDSSNENNLPTYENRSLVRNRRKPVQPLPVIEVATTFSEKEESFVDEPVLEGLSDFYDFNASINPPKSRTASRSRSRSRTPGLPPLPPRQSRSKSRSVSPAKNLIVTADDLAGISDFFDYSVKMNRLTYDQLHGQRNRNVHKTSDDFLIEQLRLNQSKGATKKNFDLKLNIIKAANHRPNSPSHLSPVTPSTSSPSTPHKPRRMSSNVERDVEFIRGKYQKNAEDQSIYVGDYMEYDEEYDEAERFRRSRSQSRSMGDIFEAESEEASASSRRDLQERILAEIAKTTINYQDFSKDLTEAFISHERFGSDSAMSAQPEIVVQIDANRRSSSYGDDLEDEEYHHYRRFSLDQEYQVEDYPNDDDYVYIEQVEVRSNNRSRSYSPLLKIGGELERMGDTTSEQFLSSVENRSDRPDDVDDSGSEDERQTVVGADDDIGDSNNIQMEEYESYIHSEEEREIKYENGNLNEGDWKMEGAVGGAHVVDGDDIDNSLKIEQIYSEMVENLEPGIERDYDKIFNEVRRDVRRDNEDTASVKTDDLLDEILNDVDDKYSHIGKRTSTFLETERSPPSNTTRTRLRTRYGITASSLSYSTYEYSESTTSETVYQPKKEYNWRKNFKLDDDDVPSVKQSVSGSDDDNNKEDEETLQQTSDLLDTRKFSLGGESITLFSRTPDRLNDFSPDNEPLIEDEHSPENDSTNIHFDRLAHTEESTIEPSKQKKKRKTRKSSSGSIETAKGLSLDIGENTEAKDVTSRKKTGKPKKRKEGGNESDKVPNIPETSSPKRVNIKPKTSQKIILEATIPATNVPTTRHESAEKVTINRQPESPLKRSPSHEPKPQKFEVSVESAGASAPALLSAGTEVKPRSPSKSPARQSESPAATVQPPSPTTPASSSSEKSTSRNRPPLERTESSGAYELIKDSSMYPWF